MLSSDVVEIRKLSPRVKEFDLRWRVTNLCNYNCDFCIQGDKKTHVQNARGESENLRGDICESIVAFLEDLEGYSSVLISLIGGEVSILNDFPDILSKLVNCRFDGDITFHITTNLSQDTSWFYRLCDMFEKQSSQNKRTLSLGASYYKAYTSAESFEHKLISLSKHCRLTESLSEETFRSRLLGLFGAVKHFDVRLSAVIPILNDEDCLTYDRMRNNLGEAGIDVSPLLIRDYKTDVSKQNKERLFGEGPRRISVIDKYGNTKLYANIQAVGAALSDRDTFCPTGYVCDAGMHNIWIDSLGTVKRCPAIGSTMELGSVLGNNLKLLDKPGTCASDHCSCNQYSIISKKC